MPVTIRIYEDHDASGSTDDIEYTSLCDECAEDHDVTYLSTEPTGDGSICDDCGSDNRDEDEEDY